MTAVYKEMHAAVTEAIQMHSAAECPSSSFTFIIPIGADMQKARTRFKSGIRPLLLYAGHPRRVP